MIDFCENNVSFVHRANDLITWEQAAIVQRINVKYIKCSILEGSISLEFKKILGLKTSKEEWLICSMKQRHCCVLFQLNNNQSDDPVIS